MSRPLYGLLAEFRDPTALVHGIRAARGEGYRKLDAFTPFPVEAVNEALELHERRLPLLVLVGGVLGGLFGYGLAYWTSAIDYPLNVGGRPLHSWPAFIPIAFETTVLGASLAAVLGMLVLNGLPRPYHPVFNVPRFERASQDAFFLVIEASDPKFDLDATRAFLAAHAGASGELTFCPHLLPVKRGILSALYVEPRASAAEIAAALRRVYAGEPFVRVVDAPPKLSDVVDTNDVLISVHAAGSGRVVVFCALDNLLKGAAGQAIQNLNLALGLDETAGLPVSEGAAALAIS